MANWPVGRAAPAGLKNWRGALHATYACAEAHAPGSSSARTADEDAAESVERYAVATALAAMSAAEPADMKADQDVPDDDDDLAARAQYERDMPMATAKSVVQFRLDAYNHGEDQSMVMLALTESGAEADARTNEERNYVMVLQESREEAERVAQWERQRLRE